MTLFDDIHEQDQARAYLRWLVEHRDEPEICPSFILIEGPEGTGKTRLAEHLIQGLICEERGSCGECETCEAIRDERHPDVSMLDGNDSLGVSDIRSLLDEHTTQRRSGPWAVSWLKESHRLTPEAGDALLKSTEDAPPRHLFVMTTHRSGELPRTLRSRATRLRTHPLSDRSLKDIFSDYDTLDVERACAWGNGTADDMSFYLEDGGVRYRRQVETLWKKVSEGVSDAYIRIAMDKMDVGLPLLLSLSVSVLTDALSESITGECRHMDAQVSEIAASVSSDTLVRITRRLIECHARHDMGGMFEHRVFSVMWECASLISSDLDSG
jgi:hypothetical protein